eukprot:COSAG06_NODE_51695_length_310_cov_1.033175_1_plen_74_part_01
MHHHCAHYRHHNGSPGSRAKSRIFRESTPIGTCYSLGFLYLIYSARCEPLEQGTTKEWISCLFSDSPCIVVGPT